MNLEKEKLTKNHWLMRTVLTWIINQYAFVWLSKLFPLKTKLLIHFLRDKSLTKAT